MGPGLINHQIPFNRSHVQPATLPTMRLYHLVETDLEVSLPLLNGKPVVGNYGPLDVPYSGRKRDLIGRTAGVGVHKSGNK